MDNELDLELDLVEFEDDDGNVLTMEILDYLNYEGKEYALLTEYTPDQENACEGCEKGACEGCGNAREAFVMEIRLVEGEEDVEEFVPVDEKLAEKLIDIFQNSEFDMEDDFDDIEDDDEE